MTNTVDSLDKVPEGDLFPIDNFYSKLKVNMNCDEEYYSVKKLYNTFKMENLDELNKFYNSQDTIRLCEVFASRGNFLNKQFKFNPRKCNSMISFSNCVHRDKSKCCIAVRKNAYRRS